MKAIKAVMLPQAQSGLLVAADNVSPCAACEARGLAVCGALSNHDLAELSEVSRKRTLEAGDYLFFEGDEPDAYYIVLDGAIKFYKLMEDGRRQVVGFLFKGDMIGEAYQPAYNFTAEAMGRTELCQLSKDKFELFAGDSAALGRRLLALASSSMAAAQNQMLLLGRKTAKERLASFFLWMSERAAERGDDPRHLYVPMSRADMGDYLGLTVETVSRMVTKLKKDGLIELGDRSLIHINNLSSLKALAGG